MKRFTVLSGRVAHVVASLALPALLALAGFVAPVLADDKPIVMPLDERLTMPRNHILADRGVFADAAIGVTPLDVISFESIPFGMLANRYATCFGANKDNTWHVQHVVRLPNQNGRAYFMVAQSWLKGGWLSLLETGPDGYDPDTELLKIQPGGKYIWQDVFQAGNPAGPGTTPERWK
ncbi:MAG: hypothetical protein ABI831_15450 [Betaproteobacteria bacterium]